MTRSLIRLLGAVLAYGGGLWWFSMFAYADWLRFVSPRAPDPATGQVIFEKAIKGVFYVTSRQAWWIQTIIPFVWVTFAVGLALIYFTAKDDSAPPEVGAASSTTERALGVVFHIAVATWIVLGSALLFFGDNVMSLIFTGSLTPPPHGR